MAPISKVVSRVIVVTALLVLAACSSVVIDPATEARLQLAHAAKSEFRHLDQPAPLGWRRLTEKEIRSFVGDRIFQTHYLDASEVFKYTFAGASVTRETLQAMTYVEHEGTWKTERGMLCAQWNVRLCYHLFTNGDMVVARRTYGNRVYVELLVPMSPGVTPALDPRPVEATSILRRCVERKPAEYQLVFSDFEGLAIAAFGDDYMKSDGLTPEWVREQMQIATLDALQAGRIERTTALFIRDTLSHCFRQAFGP